jgi:hypothetical protein
VRTNSKCGCPSVSILCYIRGKKKSLKKDEFNQRKEKFKDSMKCGGFTLHRSKYLEATIVEDSFFLPLATVLPNAENLVMLLHNHTRTMHSAHEKKNFPDFRETCLL